MKRLLFALSLLSASQVGLAQQQTFSPYSEFGVGELQQPGLLNQIGMGGVGIALYDRYHIHGINPAGNAVVQFTTLDFSVQIRQQAFTSDLSSATFKAGGLNQLAFLFTKPNLNFAITGGLAPYSRTGYEVRRLVTLTNDPDGRTLLSEAQGNGGLNRFYLGTGLRLSRQLNAGLEVSYLFGQVERNFNTAFANLSSDGRYLGIQDGTQTQITETNKPQNLRTRLGLQFGDTLYRVSTRMERMRERVVGQDSARYAHKLNQMRKEQRSYTEYRLGLIADLPVWAGVSRDVVLRNNGGGSTQRSISDTLSRGKIAGATFPYTLGVGIGLQRDLRYQLGLDVSLQNWSQYELDGVKQGLEDRLQVGLGGEWYPNRETGNFSAPFYSRIAYRAGVFYEQTYLKFGSDRIQAYGASVGLGIPIIRGSANKLDIAAQWAQQGTTRNSLVRENNLRLMVGISFTERWLTQRKYR
ncbi:MAG: hypothetical protein LW884_09150 [Bacteroidetes bacterium]|jgi:hypothetical protein|nr:hypothetical protein [Bacteroidota bacterium]